MLTPQVAAIPLSVVIATTHPWPELRMTLDSLQVQIRQLNAELIIADGDGHGLPPDFHVRFPGAIHVQNPGASIFMLRSAAMQMARGEIVAVTEDHCRLPADWCSKMLASHARYPE